MPRSTTPPGPPRSAARTRTGTRAQVLAEFEQDHQRFKAACNAAQRAQARGDRAAADLWWRTALAEWQAHAALALQTLYPDWRDALAATPTALAEAEVAHELLASLVARLLPVASQDPMWQARMARLRADVARHLRHHQRSLQPRLTRATLPWAALARSAAAQRAALGSETALLRQLLQGQPTAAAAPSARSARSLRSALSVPSVTPVPSVPGEPGDPADAAARDDDSERPDALHHARRRAGPRSARRPPTNARNAGGSGLEGSAGPGEAMDTRRV